MSIESMRKNDLENARKGTAEEIAKILMSSV